MLSSIFFGVYAGVAVMAFLGFIGDGSAAWQFVGLGFLIAAVQNRSSVGKTRLLRMLMHDLALMSLFYKVHKGKLPERNAGNAKEFEILEAMMDHLQGQVNVKMEKRGE